MQETDLINNLIFPIIVAFILFISGFLFNKYINRKKVNHNEMIEKLDTAETTPKIDFLLLEPKAPVANIYRAVDKKNCYLSIYVLFVNLCNEILIIRSLEAYMSNEVGIFQKNKIMLLATHKRQKANYSLGNTTDLLPLSLSGNTSKEAYLVFEFSNADISKGELSIKLDTSKDIINIPFNVEVID